MVGPADRLAEGAGGRVNDPRRPFVRVYFKDLKRDYPEVWFDPTCLSTWLRLLAQADEAWPAPAELPRAVRRADITVLERLGLVTLRDRGLYSMKGYDEERSQRTEKARASVSQRRDRSTNVGTTERTTVERTYNGRSTAHAGASELEMEMELDSAKGVRGKPEPVAAILPRAADLPLEGAIDTDESRVFAFLARNGAAIRPDAPLGLRLIGLIGRRGAEAIIEEAARMAKDQPLSDRQFVLGLENRLEPPPTAKSARDEDAAERVAKRDRRSQETTWRLREERFRYTGRWDPAFGPEPEWRPEWGERPAA